jgi:2-polyprenyl-3-methyl-5-hydroxy-6-metoxy-1,4-benzoquinol methylase
MRIKCLICNQKKLKKILTLGNQPFADTFINHADLKKKEPLKKLELDICSDCGNVQTKYSTNTFQRYNLYNYSYTSSNSNFSRTHWTNYAKSLIKELKINKKSKVFEIGSNDGFLLKKFRMYSKCKVVGADASNYMTKVSIKNKIKTYQMIFNFSASKYLVKNDGKFDLIVANNVFNHSDKPIDFLKGVQYVLNDNGVFVFELPYWLDSVLSKKFDQVYHEHVTYFNFKMISNLIKKTDLHILKIQKVDYHGGSIRVFLKKSNSFNKKSSIDKFIKKEVDCGLFNLKTYKGLQSFILNKKNSIHKKIYNLKKKNCVIVGIGAAAKANTLINTFDLNTKHIDFITDASKHKIGKFTPKSRIPIYSDKILTRYKNIYAIILSWNISKTLKKKLIKINNKIKFIGI